ncbi:hypothetical protein NSI01_13590 [Pimelobacter simplex]|nr:hypothetical protein NSI01_13590 [Pimelobacter simplex]
MVVVLLLRGVGRPVALATGGTDASHPGRGPDRDDGPQLPGSGEPMPASRARTMSALRSEACSLARMPET